MPKRKDINILDLTILHEAESFKSLLIVKDYLDSILIHKKTSIHDKTSSPAATKQYIQNMEVLLFYISAYTANVYSKKNSFFTVEEGAKIFEISYCFQQLGDYLNQMRFNAGILSIINNSLGEKAISLKSIRGVIPFYPTTMFLNILKTGAYRPDFYYYLRLYVGTLVAQSHFYGSAHAVELAYRNLLIFMKALLPYYKQLGFENKEILEIRINRISTNLAEALIVKKEYEESSRIMEENHNFLKSYGLIGNHSFEELGYYTNFMHLLVNRSTNGLFYSEIHEQEKVEIQKTLDIIIPLIETTRDDYNEESNTSGLLFAWRGSILLGEKGEGYRDTIKPLFYKKTHSPLYIEPIKNSLIFTELIEKRKFLISKGISPSQQLEEEIKKSLDSFLRTVGMVDTIPQDLVFNLIENYLRITFPAAKNGVLDAKMMYQHFVIMLGGKDESTTRHVMEVMELAPYFYSIISAIMKVAHMEFFLYEHIDDYPQRVLSEERNNLHKIALKRGIEILGSEYSTHCTKIKNFTGLHDIGKTVISSILLAKEGKLDDLDWSSMGMHPEIGREMLKSISSQSDYLQLESIVADHHKAAESMFSFMIHDSHGDTINFSYRMFSTLVARLADIMHAVSEKLMHDNIGGRAYQGEEYLKNAITYSDKPRIMSAYINGVYELLEGRLSREYERVNKFFEKSSCIEVIALCAFLYFLERNSSLEEIKKGKVPKETELIEWWVVVFEKAFVLSKKNIQGTIDKGFGSNEVLYHHYVRYLRDMESLIQRTRMKNHFEHILDELHLLEYTLNSIDVRPLVTT